MAVGVGAVGMGVQEEFAYAAFDGANVKTILSMTNVVVPGGIVEEVFAIREKERPPVGVVY
jgi:hypothetical protein